MYLSEGIYWLVLNEVMHEIFPAASEITSELSYFASKKNLLPIIVAITEYIEKKYTLVTYADNFNVLYHSHCIHNGPRHEY